MHFRQKYKLLGGLFTGEQAEFKILVLLHKNLIGFLCNIFLIIFPKTIDFWLILWYTLIVPKRERNRKREDKK